MAFLIKEELKTKSTTEIIDLITGNDDTVIDEIITESIDVMDHCLFKYYDTETIFNAVDGDRSLTVLKHLKSIVIREIYARRSKTMNNVAQINYDEAMTWLHEIAIGKKEAKLPLKKIDTNGDGVGDTVAGFYKFGGRKKYENRL